MTTLERAYAVIAETLPRCKGKLFAVASRMIVDALTEARITFETMRATPELFTRFHAHCRFLGVHGGEGYQYWYNAAVGHAVSVGDWPIRIVQQTVNIAGEDITVDIEVPESTRLANNRQLMLAYSVITDGAAEKQLALPENMREI